MVAHGMERRLKSILISICILIVVIHHTASTKHCISFDDPKNGYVVCDSLFRLFCSPECHPGYRFVTKPAVVYMCGPVTGEWFTYPVGSGVPWPDCIPDDGIDKDKIGKQLTQQRNEINQHLAVSNRNIPGYSPAYPMDNEDRFHHLNEYIQKAQKAYEYRETIEKEAEAFRKEQIANQNAQALNTAPGLPAPGHVNTGVTPNGPFGNPYKKNSRLVLHALLSKANRDLTNYIQKQTQPTNELNGLAVGVAPQFVQKNLVPHNRQANSRQAIVEKTSPVKHHEPVIIELPSKPQLDKLQEQLQHERSTPMVQTLIKHQANPLNKLHANNQFSTPPASHQNLENQNQNTKRNPLGSLQKQRLVSHPDQVQIHTNKLIIQQLPNGNQPSFVHSSLNSRGNGQLMSKQPKHQNVSPFQQNIKSPIKTKQLQNQFFQDFPSVPLNMNQQRTNRMKYYDNNQQTLQQNSALSFEQQTGLKMPNSPNSTGLDILPMLPMGDEPKQQSLVKQKQVNGFVVKEVLRDEGIMKELQLWNNTSQLNPKSQPLRGQQEERQHKFQNNMQLQQNVPNNNQIASTTLIKTLSTQTTQRNEPQKEKTKAQSWHTEEQSHANANNRTSWTVNQQNNVQQQVQQSVGQYQLNDSVLAEHVQPILVISGTSPLSRSASLPQLQGNYSVMPGNTNNYQQMNSYSADNATRNHLMSGSNAMEVPFNVSNTKYTNPNELKNPVNTINYTKDNSNSTSTNTMVGPYSSGSTVKISATYSYDNKVQGSLKDNQTPTSYNEPLMQINASSNSNTSSQTQDTSSRALYIAWLRKQQDTAPPPQTPEQQARARYIAWLAKHEESDAMYREWVEKQQQVTYQAETQGNPQDSITQSQAPKSQNSRDLYIAWLAKHRMTIPDYVLEPQASELGPDASDSQSTDSALTRPGRDSQAQAKITNIHPTATPKEKLFYFPVKKATLINYLLSKGTKEAIQINATASTG